MIKAVAFDFDSTLYSRDKTYEKMVDDFMEYFKEELREDVTRDEVLKALQDSDRKGIYEGPHFSRIYVRLMETGIFQTEPEFDRYYKGFIESAFPPAVTQFDDTVSTLQGLRKKGYKVGVLTNGPSKYQRDKLASTDVEENVDVVLIGGELPQQKPNRVAFEAVANALGCELEEVAYVGDHPRVDMDGARQWGMMPIWFRSVDIWLDEIEPVEISIQHLSELLEIF